MNRYLKVLKQIDKKMNARGYTLNGVNDGEEHLEAEGQTKTALYDWATQCDCGAMYYNDIEANTVSFYLVYGNAMYETISDAGYNSDKAEKDCDEVMEEVWQIYEKLCNQYA
jgi:hypothetical protein